MNEHPCEHGTSPADACDICWDRKRMEQRRKEARVIGRKKTQCGYDKPWAGPCSNPKPCAEHADLKCARCGKKAVRGCDTALQFVCGTPLCKTCGCPGCRSMGRPMSLDEAKAKATDEMMEDVRNFHGTEPKPDLKVERGLRIDAHAVVVRAVEEGIAYGLRRAHKHTDKPTHDQLQLELEAAVMNALSEVIEWY